LPLAAAQEKAKSKAELKVLFGSLKRAQVNSQTSDLVWAGG